MVDPLQWKASFSKVVQRHELSAPLREAALSQRLGRWTSLLTSAAVESFNTIGYKATAKGNKLSLLPLSRSEYLSLDVVVFPLAETRWTFPTAVVELENSKEDDKVAYSLWKVLCIRDALRVVFCYRADSEEGVRLVRHLRDDVVRVLDLEQRPRLSGDTVIVVGQKGEAESFPYSYFKWWRLNTNTTNFEPI